MVVRSGVLKHSYRGNWKMALENSVDGYHPNILHHAAMVMMTRGKADMEAVFGERSDALARDLGNGAAQLDLNPIQTRNGGRVVPPGWSKEAHEEYRAAMVARYGADAPTRLSREGPPHFCIFPNLIFILNQFRVIQPISVDETVIYYYPTLLKGAPDEINQRRLTRPTSSMARPDGSRPTTSRPTSGTRPASRRGSTNGWCCAADSIARSTRRAVGRGA